MRRRYVYRDGQIIEKSIDPRPETPAPDALVKQDVQFESRQLPKHWKNHKGSFSADGKPQFNSRYEAHEAAKRMAGEEDVICEYEGM